MADSGAVPRTVPTAAPGDDAPREDPSLHGTPLWVMGHKVTTHPTFGAYGLADVWVTPGVPGPPPHHHEDANETYVILEGEMEVLLGDTWRAVGAGDSVEVPRGTVHSFRNESGAPARFITIHDPGAKGNALFHGFGVPEGEGAFAASVADELIARVMRHLEDVDLHVAPR